MSVEFLVELGTEELPPKALSTLSQAFAKGLSEALNEAGLNFEQCQPYASPRRLAIWISGLDEKQPDQNIEKLGPNIKAAFDADGKPSKAAMGFAKGFGVEVSELEQQETDKGTRLMYRSVVNGKRSADLLPEFVAASLAKLPIPKRMRWGASRTEFVRPVKWLLMLLDQNVLDCEILGVKSSNKTYGHRFHANHAIEISEPKDYAERLKQDGKVIADYQERQSMITQQIKAAADDLDAVAEIDPALLDEVTGLVEWPVALAGTFDAGFLEVPAEALISSMKEHQKYFHLLDKQGQLKANFITLCNIESQDPQQVILGNEKVIRPRLQDAAFFFETDKKTRLADKAGKLKNIVFQNQLGSVYDKSQRIKALAQAVANMIGADSSKAARAADLCKADLVSEMVLEFSDLQGLMGYHYALHDGEDAEVAQALVEQYLPKGSDSALPDSETGLCIALADRIDTLVGIFGINQPPTGTKDPFALRRAALGILNIVVQKNLHIDLPALLQQAADLHGENLKNPEVVQQVQAYCIERFRAIYQDKGYATETFMAVQARNISDLLDFDQRVNAVQEFSQLPQASSLAAANKRVSNILAKQEQAVSLEIKPALFESGAETELAKAIETQQAGIAADLQAANYTQVLTALASLQTPVDAFFENVMVMTDNEALKLNRLAILANLHQLFLQIADISVLAPSKS